MVFSDIVMLISGIAMFLFGMSLMGDGLKKVAGSRLELTLYRLTNTPLKGILLGTGVTAVIQSSSATSIMVVGFVNSGMMQLSQAIGIILGAILGTSVTGWIIALSNLGANTGFLSIFSINTITCVMAVIGIVLRMMSKSRSRAQVGDILLGFAVLMLGMNSMSGAVEPLRESPFFLNALTAFTNPVLGILVGALFTSVLQSASAAVGILQTLTMTGVVDFETAFPLIMGIAIGAAVPVILSSLGAGVAARRTSLIYLIINVLGVVICGGGFYLVNSFVHFPFVHEILTMVSVALVNTLFRLATVIILSPFTSLLEKLTCRIIRSDKPERVTLRLEERFLRFPSLAISNCREFIDAMAKDCLEGVNSAAGLLDKFDETGFDRVTDLEDQSDHYEDAIGTYLVKLNRQELDTRQNAEVSKFLHTLTDFERISDHAQSLAIVAKEIHEKKIVYSDEAQKELVVVRGAVLEVLQTAIDAFLNDDLELAKHVEPLEQVIDALCNDMKSHHVDRIQRGLCSLKQGFTFNDILNDYERIAAHCSNVALAMLELEEDEFNTHEYYRTGNGDGKRSVYEEDYRRFSEKYAI